MIYSEGNKAVTEEFRINRIKLKYAELFPLFSKLTPPTEVKSIVAQIKKAITGKDLTEGAIFCYPQDIMRPTFLYALLSLESFKSFRMMNAYELVDIFLGNNEEISSTLNIYEETLGLYLGFHEFVNRRQSEFIQQLMYDRVIKRRITWIYYKGTKDQLSLSRIDSTKTETGFNAVSLLAKELHFPIIDMDSSGKSVPVHEDF